jgi:hypothetical protein
MSLQAVSQERRLSSEPLQAGPSRISSPEPELPFDDTSEPEEAPATDSEAEVKGEVNGNKILRNLVRTLKAQQQTSKEARAKVREPEVFDGDDQTKLRTFFLQCTLNFRDRPKAFSSGTAKVQYAISYLSGPALQYFEPAILGELIPEPQWMKKWDSFCAELEMNFGPFDNAAQAELELERIVMKEHHRAAHYFIEFSRASTRTHWNDAALKHFAYKGLAKRIKDDLLHFPRFQSLAELRRYSLEIDSRYWERKEYDNLASSSKQLNTLGKMNSSNQVDQGDPPNTGTLNSSTPEQPNNLANNLGMDGKLLPEERQRRMDKGLCLHCGDRGHMAKECPAANKTSNGRIPETKADSSASLN